MKWVRGGMLCLAGMLIFSHQTFGAITLTTCDEDSLRAALVVGGTIQFGCSGMIVVHETLVADRDATLDASGRTVLLSGVAGTGTPRVIQVNPGVSLRLINIIITNGYAASGAGLYNNAGFVSAENCTFARNQAVSYNATGGAIWNSGILTLTRCIFTENAARGAGGADGLAGTPGLYGTPRCLVMIFPGAGGPGQPGGVAFGGAIYNYSNGVASIVDCAFDSNTAIGGNGGNGGDGGNATGCYTASYVGPPGDGGSGGVAQGAAIYNSGQLKITRSTLASNAARGGDGGTGGRGTQPPMVGRGGWGGNAAAGAIWSSGDLFLTNSTIADNQAVGGVGGTSISMLGCTGAQFPSAGGNGEAGAILTSGIVVGENLTVWNNDARGGLGGPVNTNCPERGPMGQTSSGTLTASVEGSVLLRNTIIGNLNSTSNCAGVITDGGYNICSDWSAGFTNATSRNGIDPGLAPLADNGGPTRTMALLPASPALDQSDVAQCLATDQRGVPRPLGIACDIGAHEGPALDCDGRWICRLPEGWIKVQLPVPDGATLILFSSHDLITWRPLIRKSGPGLLEYLDKTVVTNRVRFFRVQ